MKKRKNFKIAAITMVALMFIACVLCSGSLFSSGVSKANNKAKMQVTVQESTGMYEIYSEEDSYNYDSVDKTQNNSELETDYAGNTEEYTNNEQVNSEGPKYTEEEIQNILNELQGDGFKNNPLRQEYESKVAGLTQYADELYSKGLNEKEVAQLLHQARRNLGVEYKDATPQPLRNYIYYINIGRYGDKLGPTYEWLIVEKGSTDAKIIESATRPNSNIDKLLAGFEEWLREQ